jgi:predicted nucleic acid-binding Zn ribbon protein
MTLESLDGLIKGLGGQESWQVQEQFRLVLLHWPKAVGAAVARNTRPVGIERNTLFVAAATAAWAQTLAYERLNILRKLNRYQRQPIRNIRFSTAQWAQKRESSSLSPEQYQAQYRLAQHPSFVGNVPHLPQAAVTTPTESFQRWAKAMQEMQRSQALCPQCGCRCPQGELNRWRQCALCAAQKM